jgi:hypothetical protein
MSNIGKSGIAVAVAVAAAMLFGFSAAAPSIAGDGRKKFHVSGASQNG